MADEDFDFEAFMEAALEQEAAEKPRDRKVDEAKEVLLANHLSDGESVFYGRQLEVMLERQFFHWITKRALNELVQEKEVGFIARDVGNITAHF